MLDTALEQVGTVLLTVVGVASPGRWVLGLLG
jgi:hypothetical protein